ncbi:hypothetical protein APHCR_1082 [Anaplasma phagocytophilum str. CR1007]|nr:hypothetical protein APHWEB_0390 [Anaplasma phagocytophilum str. Webster]KJV68350.1 hypothetical protein EPHNCH_0338 [Anaplasma phagocytophilum str. NCH-1]KJZ99293.1 hypothetical protein APHCR_1082 [Anaplasma phagocytophilum str. CR1007]KKA00622.1 hypothetical protein APHDU1_0880 [Anaplasma phagocytophilum]
MSITISSNTGSLMRLLHAHVVGTKLSNLKTMGSNLAVI